MMNVTIHQLRVFKAVANEQSVTKAAKSLHMTQPAVSNVIRTLEDQLNTKLIEVIRKKVYLTQAGKLVVDLYHKLSTHIDETVSQINSLKGIKTGTIRIATVSTAKYFVPKLLGEFKLLYPEIHIELKVKNRQEILARLAQNLDDFVIMSQLPVDNQYESQDFYEDELIVAASPNNPLSTKQKTTIQTLANEPWLIRENGSGTRIAMENLFKKYHIKPKVEMEIDNNESIKQAIIGNIGISILSHQSIKLEEKVGLIVPLCVQDFPIKHKWYLVKNKGKKMPLIADSFYEFVRSHPNLDSIGESL